MASSAAGKTEENWRGEGRRLGEERRGEEDLGKKKRVCTAAGERILVKLLLLGRLEFKDLNFTASIGSGRFGSVVQAVTFQTSVN